MPGKIKTRIVCARNLPIMDRSSDSSDAFVEIRFGNNNYDKTPVCKKSLDPIWDSKFVFEVEEDEIQEDPLQIRVLDHDTYSSHDAIGKVYIDLKPLLSPLGPTSINGFIPIYDTLHGIRGEIKIQAKLELFSDCNEYRKSSCGVQFFSSPRIPEGYVLRNFCGFVEELVLNDDPEYQWMDKIRTPRTSNEARQKLFIKLSGEVQRRIGLKVLELGANSVLGYLQNFDLEGEHGIVVRGIGTAANILKLNTQASQNSSDSFETSPTPIEKALTVNTSAVAGSLPPFSSGDAKFKSNLGTQPENQTRTAKASSPGRIPRIHSDSDLKNYQALNAGINLQPTPAQVTPDPANNRQSILEKIEYPFLTIQQYPVGFIKSICGIVCARSVKLLTSSSSNPEDDLESRDKWWTEIRNEIRSQLVSLNCQAVLGYSESKSICEDVCILSASGTAAIVDQSYFVLNHDHTHSHHHHNPYLMINSNQAGFNSTGSSGSNPNKRAQSIKSCKLCHIPYPENDLPFPVSLSTCNLCGQGLVPDIVFTSLQPLPEIETIGQGCMIRAIVTRPRKKGSGEASAKLISDYLPFLEYELHRQLVGKLKLKAMNMLYGLRVQISLGENLIIGLAEATACYAAALSQPILPKLVWDKSSKTKQEIDEIEKVKKLLAQKMSSNISFFNLNSAQAQVQPNQTPVSLTIQPPSSTTTNVVVNGANSSDSSNDHTQTDSKNLFKIELDDFRDNESLYTLLDSDGISHRKGFYAFSTELMPGLLDENSRLNSNYKHLQMFTSVYRCESSLVQMSTRKFNEICDELLESLQYKFRKNPLCCLTNLSFDTSLYDDDHAMIILTGCCLTKQEEPESDSTKGNKKIPQQQSAQVEVTSLSYLPNAHIDSYQGLVNIFLIRESTQIKEYGGLSGFMHCFIGEVLALCRAHVLSLGGNALLSFRLNECVLLDNPHKNQGQCLINISGDAVKVRPFTKL